MAITFPVLLRFTASNQYFVIFIDFLQSPQNNRCFQVNQIIVLNALYIRNPCKYLRNSQQIISNFNTCENNTNKEKHKHV